MIRKVLIEILITAFLCQGVIFAMPDNCTLRPPMAFGNNKKTNSGRLLSIIRNKIPGLKKIDLNTVKTDSDVSVRDAAKRIIKMAAGTGEQETYHGRYKWLVSAFGKVLFGKAAKRAGATDSGNMWRAYINVKPKYIPFVALFVADRIKDRACFMKLLINYKDVGLNPQDPRIVVSTDTAMEMQKILDGIYRSPLWREIEAVAPYERGAGLRQYADQYLESQIITYTKGTEETRTTAGTIGKRSTEPLNGEAEGQVGDEQLTNVLGELVRKVKIKIIKKNLSTDHIKYSCETGPVSQEEIEAIKDLIEGNGGEIVILDSLTNEQVDAFERIMQIQGMVHTEKSEKGRSDPFTIIEESLTEDIYMGLYRRIYEIIGVESEEVIECLSRIKTSEDKKAVLSELKNACSELGTYLRKNLSQEIADSVRGGLDEEKQKALKNALGYIGNAIMAGAIFESYTLSMQAEELSLEEIEKYSEGYNVFERDKQRLGMVIDWIYRKAFKLRTDRNQVGVTLFIVLPSLGPRGLVEIGMLRGLQENL